jgi:Protein of unknown function (DUF2905)
MNTAKIFIIIGLGFIVLGGLVFLTQKFNIPLGRLPGDIFIKKENSSFYFPITTCIVASVILTLILRFFSK